MKLTYWKRYDKVFKYFSSKKIYEKILEIVKMLGEPFKKKNNKGRKFKINPDEYTALIAFKISSGDDYRDMEIDSELYVKEHIDHSTFGKIFFRIPYDYLRKLLQLTGLMLEDLLRHAKIHIPDSTKLSTDRYKEIIYRGKRRRVKETFKLHIIVQRHPKRKMTIIMDGLSSDAHVSDAEGAARMSHVMHEGDICEADRGYDYEKVYRACAERRVRTNIKQQNKENGKGFRYRKKAKFHKQAYKKQRGIVETRFGAIENAGLTLAHYRTEETRFKYGLLLAFGQNINNLLRLGVEKLSIFMY